MLRLQCPYLNNPTKGRVVIAWLSDALQDYAKRAPDDMQLKAMKICTKLGNESSWSCGRRRSQCPVSRCHEPLQLGPVRLGHVMCCQDQSLFTRPCAMWHGGQWLTRPELLGRGGGMAEDLHWLQQASLMPSFGAPSCWINVGIHPVHIWGRRQKSVSRHQV